MLRVGLTGGLGSGKSTVAAMLAERGAEVMRSDDLARDLMAPGQPVCATVVRRFGPEVVRPDGALDRPALARIAFEGGHLAALEAIVHPAVIAREAALASALATSRPDAVVVVESAVLLTTRHAGEGGWRSRFDRVVVVTAPEDLRLERFAARQAGGGDAEARESALAEARRRMARQMPEARMAAMADFVVRNAGSVAALAVEVDRMWAALTAEAHG